MPWGHSKEEHPDRYHGSFATRDEAIEDGRADYDPFPFWIQGGACPASGSFMPTAEDIVEDMANRAGDEVGECAADWPDVGAAALAELDAFLAAWAKKHAPITVWTAVGAPERIAPALSIDEALSVVVRRASLGLSEVGILGAFPESVHEEVRAAIQRARAADTLDWYKSDDDPPVDVYTQKGG